MEYLYILQQALVWIITIFWLYNIVISACSLVKLKDKPLLVSKNHKLSKRTFGYICYSR